MKIVLTGGGSGGHITPLLAVAHELKQLKPEAQLIFIGQKGDHLSDLPQKNPDIDEVYFVRAGKFRRYNGQKLKQLVDLPTLAKNVRDGGRVIYGLAQSRRLLKKLKPDIILIKGGFVGVPVGLAAARLHIPFITHDSDAIPGLANRIIARWATLHTVALPKELYAYPQSKTYTVGVPISRDFIPVNTKIVEQYRADLGLDKFKQIIFITGGGNGARQLNREVVASAKRLLEELPTAVIVHIAGRAFAEETLTSYAKALPEDLLSRVVVKDFVADLYRYSGSADIIIARGSATNLAEFALQTKACIIVPATQLVWTVRNAEALSQQQAAIVISEKQLAADPNLLANDCLELINQPKKRQALAEKLYSLLAHPDASRELAELIIKSIS